MKPHPEALSVIDLRVGDTVSVIRFDEDGKITADVVSADIHAFTITELFDDSMNGVEPLLGVKELSFAEHGVPLTPRDTWNATICVVKHEVASELARTWQDDNRTPLNRGFQVHRPIKDPFNTPTIGDRDLLRTGSHSAPWATSA